MNNLKECPFCGGSAEFERLGNRGQSCIVVCENCGCRLETNEEGEHCDSQWNNRHCDRSYENLNKKG